MNELMSSPITSRLYPWIIFSIPVLGLLHSLISPVWSLWWTLMHFMSYWLFVSVQGFRLQTLTLSCMYTGSVFVTLWRPPTGPYWFWTIDNGWFIVLKKVCEYVMASCMSKTASKCHCESSNKGSDQYNLWLCHMKLSNHIGWCGHSLTSWGKHITSSTMNNAWLVSGGGGGGGGGGREEAGGGAEYVANSTLYKCWWSRSILKWSVTN